MIAFALFLATLGLAAMGMSQPQHHGWVMHRQPSHRRSALLRWSGLATVAASLVPAMAAWGPAFGTVGWAGLLSLAAFLLLLARTYIPQPPKR